MWECMLALRPLDCHLPNLRRNRHHNPRNCRFPIQVGNLPVNLRMAHRLNHHRHLAPILVCSPLVNLLSNQLGNPRHSQVVYQVLSRPDNLTGGLAPSPRGGLLVSPRQAPLATPLSSLSSIQPHNQPFSPHRDPPGNLSTFQHLNRNLFQVASH